MDFVFDLDGTICFKGKPLTDKIVSGLERLRLEGHHVIFASARPIRDMLPVLPRHMHNYTMIGGNGSLISQNGELKHSTAFSERQTAAIQALLLEHAATYLIDGQWDYSYTGADDHPILNNLDPARLANKIPLDDHPFIVKVLILSAIDLEKLAEKLSALDVVIHRHANENMLDISPKDIHKWKALRTLSVPEGAYIAFGNDANDITMFANAAHSVMIGHHDELAKYAAECIPLDESVEDRIVAKLEQLSKER